MREAARVGHLAATVAGEQSYELVPHLTLGFSFLKGRDLPRVATMPYGGVKVVAVPEIAMEFRELRVELSLTGDGECRRAFTQEVRTRRDALQR